MLARGRLLLGDHAPARLHEALEGREVDLLHVCGHMYIYIYTHVYVCMCQRVYVCKCVCAYVCV